MSNKIVDCRDNIVTTIGSIKKHSTTTLGDGTTYTYQVTPSAVSKDFEHWTNVHDFPSVYVTIDDSSHEALPSKVYRKEQLYIVTCYVKNNNDLDDILNNLVRDIEVALHQDPHRGGNAQGGSWIVNITRETRVFKPYGIAEIEVTAIMHDQA